jgi:sulfite dehydrogenase (quinone) subunit SoeC
MRPSASVILFTTASGAGYGLFVLLVLFAAVGVLPSGGGFARVAVVASHALIVGGLLASTFHLGRPERAWRALSQWRSSWLSREGAVALGGLAPSCLFALTWGFLGREDAPTMAAGALGAALAAITVFCTGMIYASLKPIPYWNRQLTTPVYLALSLMTGAICLVALTQIFGVAGRSPGLFAVASIATSWELKRRYWREIDGLAPRTTLASATGIGTLGPVRPFEAAHTGANFITHEMGYAIDRQRARPLRRVVVVALFAAPFVLIVAAITLPAPISTAAAVGAAVSAAVGVGAERWLFFAEAQHVAPLYYRSADRVLRNKERSRAYRRAEVRNSSNSMSVL